MHQWQIEELPLRLVGLHIEALSDGLLGDARKETISGLKGNDVIFAAAGNDKALMGLVSFYQQRGELTRLLSLGQQVLESTSRADVVLPLRVAVTRLLLDHRQDAARALEYARANLLARPNEVDVQLLFARALEVNNQRDAAVGGYRKVLGADATNVDAYRGLVRIFGRAQRPLNGGWRPSRSP